MLLLQSGKVSQPAAVGDRALDTSSVSLQYSMRLAPADNCYSLPCLAGSTHDLQERYVALQECCLEPFTKMQGRDAWCVAWCCQVVTSSHHSVWVADGIYVYPLTPEAGASAVEAEM